MRYELKHDKLATQVFTRASAAAKARRRAEEVYRLYEEIGRDRLLTEEELETLAPYAPVLSPTPALRDLIGRSRRQIREAAAAETRRLEQQVQEKQNLLDEADRQRRRAVGFLYGVGALLLLVIAAAVFIWRNTGNQLLEKAATREANRQYAEAIDLYQQAIAFPHYRGVGEKIETLQTDKAAYDAYTTLKNRADSLYFLGEYHQAGLAYQEADQLGVDSLETRIQETEQIRRRTLDVYLRKADAFLTARACPQACVHLRRARALAPGDEEILAKMVECDCSSK